MREREESRSRELREREKERKREKGVIETEKQRESKNVRCRGVEIGNVRLRRLM